MFILTFLHTNVIHNGENLLYRLRNEINHSKRKEILEDLIIQLNIAESVSDSQSVLGRIQAWQNILESCEKEDFLISEVITPSSFLLCVHTSLLVKA